VFILKILLQVATTNFMIKQTRFSCDFFISSYHQSKRNLCYSIRFPFVTKEAIYFISKLSTLNVSDTLIKEASEK